MSGPALPKGICPLPWLHFSANTDTSARVCCNTDHGGRIRDQAGKSIFLSELNSIDDAMNSDTQKALRREMMAGDRPEFCKKCYNIEDRGGRSARQSHLCNLVQPLSEQVAKTSADGSVPTRIISFDLSLGNHCNLKCRMCTPAASYGIAGDYEKAGLEYDREGALRAHEDWRNEEQLLRLFGDCLPTLEVMLTTGGEPFLSALHLKLLRMAVERGFSHKVVLQYHTNLTVWPNALIDLWPQFRRVEVNVSIDGVGRFAEYVRHPSKWHVIQSNMDRLLRLREKLNIAVDVNTCFQALTVLRMTEVLEFMQKYADQLPPIPHFNMVDNPQHFAADVLPRRLRQLAHNQFEKHLLANREFYTKGPFEKLNAARIHLAIGQFEWLGRQPFDRSRWARFVTTTRALDKVRGQSLSDHVTEFTPYLGAHWVGPESEIGRLKGLD